MKRRAIRRRSTLPQRRAAYLQQDLRRVAGALRRRHFAGAEQFYQPRGGARRRHVRRMLCAAQASGASDDAATLALALGFSRAIPRASLRSEGDLDLGENVMRYAFEDAGVSRRRRRPRRRCSAGARRRREGGAAPQHRRGRRARRVATATAFLSDGERDEAMVFGSDRFEQLAHHFSLPYFGPDPAREADRRHDYVEAIVCGSRARRREPKYGAALRASREAESVRRRRPSTGVLPAPGLARRGFHLVGPMRAPSLILPGAGQRRVQRSSSSAGPPR